MNYTQPWLNSIPDDLIIIITMRKFVFFIIVIFCALETEAQNYFISFTGAGASSSLNTVKVENLKTGISLTLNGNDILHLTGSTGINPAEDGQSSELKVFPNPSEGITRLQISPPGAGEAIITLYDLTGKQVAQVKNYLDKSEQEFQISGLGNGFYLISVKGIAYHYSGRLLSNSHIKGNISIEQISSNKAVNVRQSDEENKGSQATVEMVYATGDRLKFTGTSGNYSTVKTDIPSGDKTITFNLLACADADNNNYPVVEIGTQVWMAENLKSTKYRDGTNITNITDNTAWSARAYGAYCWLYNSEENKDIYGALYNWWAVDTRKLCPIGWHAPTDAEWNSLTTFIGGTVYAGRKLKETGTVHWSSPNTEATNETGFTALPGGYRPGDFQNFGKVGYWWSATRESSSTAWGRWIENNGPYIGRLGFVITNGQSVRCLKDKDNSVPPGGDWTINTDFGKLVFTVDGSGLTISKMDYLFSSFKCGPVTVSGGITISQTPPWPITNGDFLIANRLDTNGNQIMTISGTYDASGNKFSGTWSCNSYGTVCSGTWEAPAP